MIRRATGGGSDYNQAQQEILHHRKAADMNDHPTDNSQNQDKNQESTIKDFQRAWAIQSSEKTTAFSREAIRACLLINGTAAVSILAYLGHTVSQGFSVTHGQILSMLFFCLGAIFVVPCFFFSYLAQMRFTHFVESLLANIHDHKLQKSGTKHNQWAVIFGSLSVLSFIIGAIVFAGSLW